MTYVFIINQNNKPHCAFSIAKFADQFLAKVQVEFPQEKWEKITLQVDNKSNIQYATGVRHTI
jgi:hypothetical protein